MNMLCMTAVYDKSKIFSTKLKLENIMIHRHRRLSLYLERLIEHFVLYQKEKLLMANFSLSE